MAKRSRRTNRWPRYVSVSERRMAAAQVAKSEVKKGRVLQPVQISGRAIATSFWGKAWCQHLEKFSDYSNRLPRGRTYARNGSVIHLEIDTGKITAMVSGSYTYNIDITIKPLPAKKWNKLKSQCVGGIDSALELLQGNLSNSVMQTVCDRDNGLFPSPKEIQLNCDCPDWADLCKHLAAVLYGVGARLDQAPELLFLLRGVDHEELIGAELSFDTKANTGSALGGDLSAIFGIDIDSSLVVPPEPKRKAKKKSARKKRARDVTVNSSANVRKKAEMKRPATKKRALPPSRLTQKPVAKSTTNEPKSGINISRGMRASHVRKLRKIYQLSVAELAKLTNITTATIHRWEKQTGVITVRATTLKSISRVFDMSYDEAMRKLRRR